MSLKSKYINKYDYIYYYTKQKNLWFYNNAQILSSLTLMAKIYQNDFNDLSSEDEYEDEMENDYLSYYKEIYANNMDVDLKDPKIIEGKILDNASKKHILNTFIHIKTTYDFDNDFLDNVSAAKKTLSLLENNEQIIIFQPTFINNNLVTKCDAIVKEKNHIKIIETKGTATVKLHHFLDLFFQSQVLNQEALIDYSFEFYLCIVDYVAAKKGTCPFVITPYFNYQKNLSNPTKKDGSKTYNEKIWRLMKQGQHFVYDKTRMVVACPILINDILNGECASMEMKAEIAKSTSTKKSIENIIRLIHQTINEFDMVIDTLIHAKKTLINKQDNEYIKDVVPSWQDNGPFKKTDYWLMLKKIYQLKGYELFFYSGNVIKQDSYSITNYQINDDLLPYFKDGYASLFINNISPIVIDKLVTNGLLKKIKLKKVYFDFETINLATRVIDDIHPFCQIVTQCSIIKLSNDNDLNHTQSNNIVLDPLNITIHGFKTIIDALYNGEDTSYIVYNQSFEKSRLKEMIKYINDPIYTKKILVIINNLFDLADFFTIKTLNHGKEKNAPILIKELGGFYSIKKVLPYIAKHQLHLFTLTKCLNYSDLAITNGLECQNMTTLRFFNQLSSDEWKNLVKNISIYCENDVRAMIAIELFVRKIFEELN